MASQSTTQKYGHFVNIPEYNNKQMPALIADYNIIQKNVGKEQGRHDGAE